MYIRIYILFQLVFIGVISGCQYRFKIKHSYENGVNVTVLYSYNETGIYEDNWIVRTVYNMSYEAVGWENRINSKMLA